MENVIAIDVGTEHFGIAWILQDKFNVKYLHYQYFFEWFNDSIDNFNICVIEIFNLNSHQFYIMSKNVKDMIIIIDKIKNICYNKNITIIERKSSQIPNKGSNLNKTYLNKRFTNFKFNNHTRDAMMHLLCFLNKKR